MAAHHVIAAFLSIVAGAFDLRTRRIPNLLTFGAALAGVGYHAATGGLTTAGWSAAGLAAGLLLFFPFFALGGLGAGDVKLVAALGAWVGLPAILWVAFYTAIAGGVLALLAAAHHGLLGATLRNLWLLLTHWRVAGPGPLDGLTLKTASGPRLPYSLPIAAGVFLTLWLR